MYFVWTDFKVKDKRLNLDEARTRLRTQIDCQPDQQVQKESKATPETVGAMSWGMVIYGCRRMNQQQVKCLCQHSVMTFDF